MRTFGKLSLKGSAHFEDKMTRLLSDISMDIEESIDSNLYKCILLIGGYGRGEGGVLSIQDIEFPHNNLDFLIVSKSYSKHKEDTLRNEVNDIILKYCTAVGIDFDLSIIGEFKLKNSTPLVITYDMKYGHKVINGDATFLKNIKQFDLKYIPNWDIRNLMVNRGTLLTINDLILSKKYHTMKDIRTVIKHCIKAIIGYGDALLYYHGAYHYSYVQKQKNMILLADVDAEFKQMYDDAMSFRFEPDYEKYMQEDLITFQEKVKLKLQQIHLQCESFAVRKQSINWKYYLEMALNSSSSKDLTLKMVLKNIRNLLISNYFITELSLTNSVKAKMLGIRGILPLLFPFVAFQIQSEKSTKILNSFFKVKTDNPTDLKQQYLVFWGKYINNNFSFEEYGLEKGSL